MEFKPTLDVQRIRLKCPREPKTQLVLNVLNSRSLCDFLGAPRLPSF